MNPPFGTREKGIDSLFVEKALEVKKDSKIDRSSSLQSAQIINKECIYQLTNKQFFINKSKKLKCTCTPIAQLKFDIPKLYKFHTKESSDIDVDLLRFEKIKK